MSVVPEQEKMIKNEYVCSEDICSRVKASSSHQNKAEFSKFLGVTLKGPWPSVAEIKSESLWQDQITVVLVIRRLGCPFCRKIFRDVSSRRKDFDALNVNLVAVSQQDIYAQDFLDEVWDGLPLYIDGSDGFRQAMNGGDYSVAWLCKPRFCLTACCGNLPKAGGFADSNDKAKRRGGELVFGKGGSLRLQYLEDSDFGHAAVDDLLAACRPSP